VLNTAVVHIAMIAAASALSFPPSPQTRTRPTAPEKFSINAAVNTGAGGSAGTFTVAVDRYNTEKERALLADALEHGGYPSFLPKLRQASVVGHLTFGEKTWNIRYAYQQPNEKGRRIVIVTDQPVYFVGGGQTDAKPREGYGVAVVQIEVDDVGLGKGTMAAAARVKPGGPGGVQIDDYADKPIDLVTVRRMQ